MRSTNSKKKAKEDYEAKIAADKAKVAEERAAAMEALEDS